MCAARIVVFFLCGTLLGGVRFQGTHKLVSLLPVIGVSVKHIGFER